MSELTIEQYLARVAKSRSARLDAHADWIQAVMDAHRAGLSYRKIAEAAGVSHPRIQQIVNAERDPQKV